jgi:predicted dehydrogenase
MRLQLQGWVQSGGGVGAGTLRLHFPQWPRAWQRQPWVGGSAQGGAMREVGTHYVAAVQELFGGRCVRRVRTCLTGGATAEDAEVAAQVRERDANTHHL